MPRRGALDRPRERRQVRLRREGRGGARAELRQHSDRFPGRGLHPKRRAGPRRHRGLLWRRADVDRRRQSERQQAGRLHRLERHAAAEPRCVQQPRVLAGAPHRRLRRRLERDRHLGPNPGRIDRSRFHIPDLRLLRRGRLSQGQQRQHPCHSGRSKPRDILEQAGRGVRGRGLWDLDRPQRERHPEHHPRGPELPPLRGFR